MNQVCILLTVPNGNQMVHDENFDKLKSVEEDFVFGILDGRLEDVDMHDVAQYYSYFGFVHTKSNLTIVLPTNIEKYLVEILPSCNYVIEFSNEWQLDAINQKRQEASFGNVIQKVSSKRVELKKEPNPESLIVSKDKMCNHFANVYIGGTFDHLHAGHKLLITQMLYVTKGTCTAAVANGDLLKNKKFKEALQSFQERSAQTETIMRQIRPDVLSQTCELLDPFGPPITDETCDCLVVSLETIKGGEKINEIRREKHWKEVYLSCVPLVQYKNAK